jgi:hypothetical protein
MTQCDYIKAFGCVMARVLLISVRQLVDWCDLFSQFPSHYIRELATVVDDDSLINDEYQQRCREDRTNF